MKEISCEVIRDLFLPYLDGTASQDTREAGGGASWGCKACRDLYEEMKTDFLTDSCITEGRRSRRPARRNCTALNVFVRKAYKNSRFVGGVRRSAFGGNRRIYESESDIS